MRSRLRELLRCSFCRGELRVEPLKQVVRHGETDVTDGWLHCECGANFPIIRGIPRMLRNASRLFADFYVRHNMPAYDFSVSAAVERARKIFGYQWMRFPQVPKDFRDNFLNYISPVREDFFPGKFGIDVGCGNGRHAYNAALFGAEIIALDISDAVEAAAANTCDLANVHVVQADMYHMPFADDVFDFAYSIGVLHHLPKPEDGFRAVVNIVKPDGAVFVWVYSKKRKITNAVIETIRAAMTRMPVPFQIAVSLAAAVIDWMLIKLFSTLSPRLKLYSQYPFSVVWADWFDRLAAPIRFYFDEDELEEWLSRASLKNKKISPTGLYGWRAYGERNFESPKGELT